jgi:hypothetical protein
VALVEFLELASPRPDILVKPVKPQITESTKTEPTTLPLTVISKARKVIGEAQGLDSDEKTFVLVNFLSGLHPEVSPDNEFIAILADRAGRKTASAKEARIRRNKAAQLQLDLFPTISPDHPATTNGNTGYTIVGRISQRLTKHFGKH